MITSKEVFFFHYVSRVRFSFRLGKCKSYFFVLFRHFNGIKSFNRKEHTRRKRKKQLKYVKRRICNQKLSVVSLYILIRTTRCRIVALSVVVKFMIVQVLNDKELPNNLVCKEKQFSSKDGWSKCYYSCAFPVRIFNNSVSLPRKDLHIEKVKLLSYKEYLFVGRFSQVGEELIICLTTLNIVIFTLILCLFYCLV